MKRIFSVLALSTVLCSSPFMVAAQEDVPVFISPKPVPADVTPQVAMQFCGNWTGHYGPIDYRTATLGTKKRVEVHHFDTYLPQYLAWIPGQAFSHDIAANFSYTLKSFPNHPASLSLMEQIGRRLKTENIPGSAYPLECWYVRGLQATPDDPVVRAMYGIYLAHRRRPKEALANLAAGERGTCSSGVMQHQIATGYLAAGDNARAQIGAMRAEKLGFLAASVRSGMEAGGKWDKSLEPGTPTRPDVCADDAAAAAAAASAPGLAEPPATRSEAPTSFPPPGSR